MSGMPKKDKWIVLGRNRDNNKVHRVWGKKTDGQWQWKHSKDSPGKNWKCRFGNKSTAQLARDWSEKKGRAVYMSKDLHPFVVVAGHTSFGNKELSKRLNKVGIGKMRYIRAGSFLRPPKHKGSSSANCGSCQHCLYQKYLNGTGNLAAKCACFTSGSHSHSKCDSCCSSHHCKGLACDTSFYKQGRDGAYVNLGNDSTCRELMKKNKLVLNVSGEPWHVVRKETDSVWRS